ncbi:hypothetical protein MMC22_009225 [Lobaria immixta]|nr:hypothetical protein [Lobaria immixta]
MASVDTDDNSVDMDEPTATSRHSLSGISSGSPIQEPNPTEVQALEPMVLPRRNKSKNPAINLDLPMEEDWGDEALKDQEYADTARAKRRAGVKKQAARKTGAATRAYMDKRIAKGQYHLGDTIEDEEDPLLEARWQQDDVENEETISGGSVELEAGKAITNLAFAGVAKNL